MLPESSNNNDWPPNLWEELEIFAREVVDRHAKLRHLIPRGPDELGAYTIVEPKTEINKNNSWQREYPAARPPEHRQSYFTIKPEQIGDAKNARLLVERASRTLAGDEDRLLFDALVKAGTKDPVKGTFKSMAQLVYAAVAKIETEGTPFSGPFVLAWYDAEWGAAIDGSTERYARGQREAVTHVLGAGGAIIRVPGTVTGATVSAAPTRDAVVFARDSFGLDLVYAAHPQITFCGHVDDALKFKVEQRFMLRILSEGCCTQLPAPPPKES